MRSWLTVGGGSEEAARIDNMVTEPEIPVAARANVYRFCRFETAGDLCWLRDSNDGVNQIGRAHV